MGQRHQLDALTKDGKWQSQKYKPCNDFISRKNQWIKKIWKENSFLIWNDLWMKTRPYFSFEWLFIHCGREVISDYKSHLLWRQKGTIFLWPHTMFGWYKKARHSIDFKSMAISHLTSVILASLQIYWKTYCRFVANFDIESILKSFGIMFIVILVNLLYNLIGLKEKPLYIVSLIFVMGCDLHQWEI